MGIPILDLLAHFLPPLVGGGGLLWWGAGWMQALSKGSKVYRRKNPDLPGWGLLEWSIAFPFLLIFWPRYTRHYDRALDELDAEERDREWTAEQTRTRRRRLR